MMTRTFLLVVATLSAVLSAPVQAKPIHITGPSSGAAEQER